MKSLWKLYRRYVVTAALIAGIVLFMNIIVIGTVILMTSYTGKNELGSMPRRSRLEQISNSFIKDGEGRYELTDEGKETLDLCGAAFAFLLSDTGERIWEWNVPAEIPERFTLGQVASFSRWYLEDYPVYVWNGKEGLFVLGSEKNKIARYSWVLRLDLLNYLPEIFLVILGANVILILLLALLFGNRLYQSMLPLAKGIESLSAGRYIYLPEKGLTEELDKKLNQTAAILKRQQMNLEKRDTARTDWISGVSHDIRTPLSMVMGYADNLEKNEALPEEARQQANIIKNQSLRIKTLIEDLNLTSKLEYHMQPLRCEDYIPAALLRTVAVFYLNQGLPEGYELSLEAGEELENVVMRGDTSLLSRALGNLVNNSIRHNEGGCRIVLAGQLLEKEGEKICRLYVADDGKGIPQTVRDILALESENGADNGPPIATGTAAEETDSPKPHIMGLRIVMQIVNAHGGRLVFGQDGRETGIELPVTGRLENNLDKKKKKWWQVLWSGEVKYMELD